VVDVYFDYVELGKKEYPYWEIIHIDTGSGSGFASFWINGQNDVENASFIEQSFMLQSKESSFDDAFYQEILNTTKQAGVRALFHRRTR
jgi:hypothetical protein